MKQIPGLCLAILLCSLVQAQPRLKDKKYPSLMWEISGKGLKKPSYLFGTMHVSSKLAFNLPDSFYLGIRNAQVVALETNPETWQEDMNKYDLGADVDYTAGYRFGNYLSMPGDFLSINTLKFYKYDKKIERALYSNPSTINNLLYRSYGNESSDFEEDTYLDMYIFQCGKKWSKKIAGVENYGESMKLMAEAYKDAIKDKNKKERSYGDRDDAYSADKLQEAYRNGNLDLLDSINRYNSVSDAFDEKFLYKRNQIQANSIDSIIRSGATLFVGVGAAHLPGQRGVIEILRQRGYKLRPVKMGERASKDKDQVERLRVPVVFRTEASEDGFLKVDIPGKFYKYGDDQSLEQQQYADMANGSYYIVTRIMTNAWMWGHNTDDVYRILDSLLYENIPGKILSKNPITRNAYKGVDIINRTRRGDVQRYNIFITPFEIIFFKMSGTGDYVKKGEEANKFFGSIVLKEYAPVPVSGTWKKYSPPSGGFSIDLPHEPFVSNDGSWIYDATDKTNGGYFRIIRTDIHNYRFVEEDTFDLGLMEESFMASEFIDSQLSRKQTRFKGYPALDARYRLKSGGIFLTRFIIQGPHYYTLLAYGAKEIPSMQTFLNSFNIVPYIYKESKRIKDTALYYTVSSPVFPEERKIKLSIPRYDYFGTDEEEDQKSEKDLMESGAYRNKTVSNDTTGEKIYISFYRFPRYYYSKDSSELDKDAERHLWADTAWILKSRKKYQLANNTRVWEDVVTDTGSSRTLWTKSFYKDGIGFSLMTQSDTLSEPSAFIKMFYETFSPEDSLRGVNPFEKKTKLFFDDFVSKDSVLHKRAVRSIDFLHLKTAINCLNWSEKKYLGTKKSLIEKIGDIPSTAAANYLKDLYYVLDDTVQLQYTVLESLLQQKTAYAYSLFREIVNTEPPVLAEQVGSSSLVDYPDEITYRADKKKFGFDDGSFLDELFDSLKLTKTILPDLLPLLNLEDYKSGILQLLGNMVDSNLVQPKDYEMYFSKFLIEARQELKKQSITEKRKAIEKAEENKDNKKAPSPYGSVEDKDYGNDRLGLYATLLLPFWDKNPGVQPLIQQMLRSRDKRLKYTTLLLLMRNNRPYPDSLLKYFAESDEFRYELYSDLKDIKKPEKFPVIFNNHFDLGKSSLLARKSYSKPDSLVYIDRLPAEYKGKRGFIYFYKYKTRKDDLNWKLAVVGLTPEDPAKFEFEYGAGPTSNNSDYSTYSTKRHSNKDFTGFTDTRIDEEESLKKQLNKALKKLLYSRRKSAREFYNEEADKGDGEFGE
jgi:uncharacterized protein YbaP (TraB family)